MSIYPSPKLDHNGNLNTILNSIDYENSSGEITLARGDERYLKKNSGTLNIDKLIVTDLATIEDLTVAKLFKAKQTSDALTTAIFSSNQVYDLSNNGMVYSISSDATSVNSVSFINIPDLANQSYIFTFLLKPSQADTPYYIDTSNITVNGDSVTLHGLQNISLPSNYTYLVQQITIIYEENGNTFALTSVSAY
jgi:hypothetical protein